MMEKYAIIVAGGSGLRMKSVTPKQFALLAGKPVLLYSIEAFLKAFEDIRIVIVIQQGMEAFWFTMKKEYQLSERILIVHGGTERFHSVKNGLEKVPDDVLVGIHDAARPLIDAELIGKTFQIAEKKKNCIPAIFAHDSVRILDDVEISRPVPRERVQLIQTPQVFYSTPLKKAYRTSFHEQFTDDASIWEFAGNKVEFCEGSPFNLKITIPSDFALAEALLMARQKEAGSF